MRGLQSACACVALMSQLHAGEDATNIAAKLTPVAPFPSLIAVARTNGIPLDGIDPTVVGAGLKPGDTASMLVTLFEKRKRQTQWLLYLQVLPPPPSAGPTNTPPPMTLYSSSGTKLEFPSSSAFVSLRTLGPFVPPEPKRRPPKARSSTSEFALNEGFLHNGLDRAGAVMVRLKETNAPGVLNVRTRPPSASQVAEGRQTAATINLTLEDERALAGSVPALTSYMEIIQKTEGLKDMLFKVVDMPSLWSFVRERGVTTELRIERKRAAAADVSDWKLTPPTAAYHFPLSLYVNKEHALDVTMIATRPEPPLLSCGGVVGLLAERPNDPEIYLSFRVMSAHCAPSTP